MTQTVPGSVIYRQEVGASDTLEVGLRIAKGMSRETWATLGRRLGKLDRHLPWRLGDWAFHGEASYGSRYDEMCEITGLEYQTLANYASVAGRIEIYRRRENLSFSHHAEIASMGSDEEQDAWLDKASEESLSVHDLRKAIKAKALPEGADDSAVLASSSDDVTEAESAPSESAELMRHLEDMRFVITLDDVRTILPRAEAEDLSPAGWLRRYLDEVSK